MIKKSIFALFSVPILFITLFSTLFNSPVYAAKCQGWGPTPLSEINVTVSPSTVTPTDSIKITYPTPDDANYTIYIRKLSVTPDIINDFDLGRLGPGGSRTTTLTVANALAGESTITGYTFLVQVANDAGTRKCGETSFKVSLPSSGEPQFNPGAPLSEYASPITTIPMVGASGLVEGKKYRFALSGSWSGYINEKGGASRGSEIPAGLGGTITILDVCSNGVASVSCSGEFSGGDYIITLFEAETNKVLASASFKIALQPFDDTGGAPTVNTPFGDISTSPSGFATKVLQIAIGIAGGLAFILMAIGAFRMTTSAGNPDNLQSAREMFTAAIIGLIVIVFSIFLLRLIGITILRLPGFG